MTCLWVISPLPRRSFADGLLTCTQWVGNNKLTNNQERLHFGLWAIAKSPLVIGADLSKLPEPSLEILRNKVCIHTLL